MPKMIDGLTEAQAKILLYKNNTGDWLPGHRYSTIRTLIKKGYLEMKHPYLVLTKKGRDWCYNNHMKVPTILKKRSCSRK